MAWIFDTSIPTFPQNMDELHKRLKLGVQTSVFNITLNPIKLNDNPDTYFDILKTYMSIGYSGPDLEIGGDYYFSSFFGGTQFFQISPPPGKVPPCYMSEVGAGMFKTNMNEVKTEKQQGQLMERYSAGIITQTSFEGGSIISPTGIIPGPFEQYPVIVKSSDEEEEQEEQEEQPESDE